MKRTPIAAAVLLVAALVLLVHPVLAQKSGPPRLSPSAAVSQVAGITEIAINNARPSVRERTIWGELVPYGEIWRTGANEATTFALSGDATIEGKPLAAGTYSLFTIPGKDKWTVVFNKVAEQWGHYGYDAGQDALRIEVEPTAAPFAELLTIAIDEVTSSSARVVIHWEKVQVRFGIKLDTPKLAYERALKEAAENDRAAFSWAGYFYREGIHTEKALEWTNAAVAAQPSYRSVSLQARLLHQAGQTDEARAAAQKAIALAQAAEGQYAEAARDQARELAEEMKDW